MNTRTITSIVLLALASACSTAATGKGETSVTSANTMPPCPLGVSGAEVSVEDTPQGVALTFTATSAEKVDDLRARGRHAAGMYGPRKAGEGHDGRHATGGHHGLMPMQMPPAFALTRDVENGIEIRLSPADDKDLSALRARARERAVAMSTSCR